VSTEQATLYVCIREVSGLNLSWLSGYLLNELLLFCSVTSNMWWDSAFKSATTAFFQAVVYPSFINIFPLQSNLKVEQGILKNYFLQ
jgi:hypothetical protein